MMENLTERQQRVIDLMKEGWELGISRTYGVRAWLQKDGIGRGGESEDVYLSTFYSLSKKGYIILKKEGFPTSTYKLNTTNRG